MTSISNRALLVSLSISQWAARKLDKSETAAVAAKHGTHDNVARVNKSLLPMADSLDAIHKLTTSIRNFYYKTTLPWRDGSQIIKSDGYLDFVNELSAQKLEWQTAVNNFIADYPQLREDAKLLLNTLYRDEDYPDTHEVAAKFSMDVSFFPVPEASDWRVDLGDEHLEALRQQINDSVSDHLGSAMKVAWQRVYDVVSKAHERLSQPDAIFRDSLVDNAVELCHLLPSLNLTDDPALEGMRVKLEKSLCSTQPDALRNDPLERSRVSKEMADIMSNGGVVLVMLWTRLKHTGGWFPEADDGDHLRRYSVGQFRSKWYIYHDKDGDAILRLPMNEEDPPVYGPFPTLTVAKAALITGYLAGLYT